jgi:Kef-type K+ transport system membrane component KefB
MKKKLLRRTRHSEKNRLRARLISLGVLLLLALFVLRSPLAAGDQVGAKATFCLGFILLFGYYLARTLEAARLPAITSYILVGVVCGPFVLNLLSTDVIAELSRLDDLALAIIALMAGGEMRLAMLRARAGAFASVIAFQIVFSMLGAIGVIFLMKSQISAVDVWNAKTIIAVGLLFGLVTVARSPATTIGVVTETRARGPLTEVLIGVTVLLDVVILLMAAVIVPAAQTLVSGSAFSLEFATELGLEVFGSILAGLFFGLSLRFYIRWVGGYLPLFILGMGLIGSAVCHHYHLSPLLSFMIAGFYVENFSLLGDRLIVGLEKSAFPVYVLFFAISGASIDLAALRVSWILALALVGMRMAAFYVGSFAASRFVPSLRSHGHSMWSGFLAQAGVTIGIAAIIEKRFAFGADIKTIVLATVAINQLIGPIALKLLLQRSGEAGGMDRD